MLFTNMLFTIYKNHFYKDTYNTNQSDTIVTKISAVN